MRMGSTLLRAGLPLIVVLVLLGPTLGAVAMFVQVIAPYVVGGVILFLVVLVVLRLLNAWGSR